MVEQASATGAEPGRVPAAAWPDPDRLSANAFFNALLRETAAGTWTDEHDARCPAGMTHPAVRIDLPGSRGGLWLGVAYRSLCGRHKFALPVHLEDATGRCRPLSLSEAMQAVARERHFFPQADAAQRRQFVARAEASRRNLAQGVAARRSELSRLFAEPLGFAEAEQALLSGHAVHPTPKSRDPLTDGEARTYAPEFGNAFALEWLGVAEDHLHGDSGDDADAAEFAQALWRADPAPADLPSDLRPLPAHPWQWQRLQADPRVARLRKTGRLQHLGRSRAAWRATSSLRAVHAGHSPWMLKFSLSLRLTNSLRTLQPEEMARGLEVPRIRTTPVGRAFAARYPDFRILAEPAYLMLADSRGQPIAESLALFRENPFQGAAATNTCLLATLTQDDPAGGSARVARLVRRHADRHGLAPATAGLLWFDRFLDAVVEPLLIAQADYGLLFGAHQQNLIVSFDGELPVAGAFRDCQGTGYSRLGARLLADDLPGLGAATANLLDDDMANRLFAYYLIVNSCFGLISAIGAAGVMPETELLDRLRTRLVALRDGPRRDRSCLDYLLDADALWAKGNFQCAITGLNETTTTDPLVIYHRLPNPLQQPQGNRA